MSDTRDEPGPSRGRKRVRNPVLWQQNVAKVNRNLGKAYVSRATGRHVPEKEMGAPCPDGCYTKITMPVLSQIHSDFWKNGDFALQNAFIQKHVKNVPVQRRRKVAAPQQDRRRTVTRQYTLSFQGNTHKVCKKGFLSVLAISETRVRTDLNSMSATGSPHGDMRGRHPQSRKITDEKEQQVKDHIASFPTVSSHYSRAKSPNLRYLEPILNIKKMYRLYNSWMEDEHPNDTCVKESYYRKIFSTKFRLGFNPPQTDTCAKCDMLKVAIGKATEQEKPALRDELQLHTDLANRGLAIMKSLKDDNDPETRCVCLDLQQVLPIPRMSTSVAYYKKKLCMYNLCINDIKQNKSKFYVWDEVTAGRGSIEIAACLKKWIDEEYAKEDFSCLKVVTDNCGGQNKNLNLILYYLREHHDRRLTHVEHFYLVPGHSYMACDRGFGNIEKNIRQTGEIYDFQGYCKAIKTAVIEKNEVIEMQHNDFLDLEVLQKYVTIRRPKNPYSFLNARRFVLRLNFREGYLVGNDYTGPLGSVRLMKGTENYRPSQFNLATVALPVKYTKPRKLNPGKLAHLKDLVAYVPMAYTGYFSQLFREQQDLEGNTQESDDEEEDVDNDILDYDE